MNSDPEISKINTKDGEIEELKYERKKHGYEVFLKLRKIDNEFHRKTFKGLNR